LTEAQHKIDANANPGAAGRCCGMLGKIVLLLFCLVVKLGRVHGSLVIRDKTNIRVAGTGRADKSAAAWMTKASIDKVIISQFSQTAG
jgi:hypothetical protein